MNVDRRGTVIYPMFPDNNSLIMSLQAIERTTIPSQRATITKTGVRAATLISSDSSTEVIDVNRLSQRKSSVIQYVEVADSKGHLHCVDSRVNASCWVKIVTLAKDCQSCNVLLMSTEKGVVLKVMRCIDPGEPLLMWFTENVLAMMNMPFLSLSNIQGQNRYTCHICNNHFEYPNPLKVHLALKCNRLDNNHLWTILAREFLTRAIPTSLSFDPFTQQILPFRFELTGQRETTIAKSKPIIIQRIDPNATLRNISPTSSSHGSPESSKQPSPASSNSRTSSNVHTTSNVRTSSNSSRPSTDVRKNLTNRGISAFKPYENKPQVFTTSATSHQAVTFNNHRNETIHGQNTYHHVAPTLPMRNDAQAARMETFVSNLGKSKKGHECIYCNKIYSRKYGLKIHIRTHTGYKPLKCKFCLRPFGDPSNLNKHVRLHADGETPYRCDLCGKVLVRRRDLERHIKSRHQDSVDRISDMSSDGMNI